MSKIETIKSAYTNRKRIQLAYNAYRTFTDHFDVLVLKYGYQFVSDAIDDAKAIAQPLIDAKERIANMRWEQALRRSHSLGRGLAWVA